MTGKLLALDRALEPALPALLALLDVPVDDAAWQALDPAQRRQRTLDAVKRLLLRESQEQPLLVVFEDLHWIDGETQALLDGLVESLPRRALLLLVNYRPEYQHAWGSKTYYSQLRLDPLPAESAEELLDALLGDDPGSAPLKQLLVERTRATRSSWRRASGRWWRRRRWPGSAGAYRLTQPVHDDPGPGHGPGDAGGAHRPAAARRTSACCRRPPSSARTCRSRCSRRSPSCPRRRSRRGLAHLQAAEFLYETGLFPDLEYTFKHALTHEVTYGGLLQERRRELHARIVEAIETLHRDRLGEQIERLAHHALRGELREKAVHYLRQAGLKAAARSALPDARGWFEQALGVLEALPESPSTLEQAFEIRLELRPVLSQLGEVRRALERLREAEALAERLNDDRRRGRVCAFMTNVHSHARRAGRGARDRHPRAGDRRAPRGLETPHPRPRPISSRRTTTGASTSGWSSWPPTTSRRCPPTGSTSISEPPHRHRSTIAAGWS